MVIGIRYIRDIIDGVRMDSFGDYFIIYKVSSNYYIENCLQTYVSYIGGRSGGALKKEGLSISRKR